MAELQKIESRYNIRSSSKAPLRLKVYQFDSCISPDQTTPTISHALSTCFPSKGSCPGKVGVAFLYGYYGKKEEETQAFDGMDIAIFRIDPLKDVKLVPNPMIHFFTIERESPSGKWAKLHPGRDGALCSLESVILGRESELLLRILSESNPPEPTSTIGEYLKVIEQYFNTWPALPYN